MSSARVRAATLRATARLRDGPCGCARERQPLQRAVRRSLSCCRWACLSLVAARSPHRACARRARCLSRALAFAACRRLFRVVCDLRGLWRDHVLHAQGHRDLHRHHQGGLARRHRDAHPLRSARRGVRVRLARPPRRAEPSRAALRARRAPLARPSAGLLAAVIASCAVCGHSGQASRRSLRLCFHFRRCNARLARPLTPRVAPPRASAASALCLSLARAASRRPSSSGSSTSAPTSAPLLKPSTRFSTRPPPRRRPRRTRRPSPRTASSACTF